MNSLMCPLSHKLAARTRDGDEFNLVHRMGTAARDQTTSVLILLPTKITFGESTL